MQGRRLVVLALTAALALSTAVRVWGTGFAPTAPLARPDEQTFIVRGLEMFQGPRGPDIFRSGWPEGFFRITHFLEWAEGGVLSLVSGRPINLGCLYALNPGALELPLRLWSAFTDVLSCLLIGTIVRRLWQEWSQQAALEPLAAEVPFLCGSLALGANYLAIRNAHFGVSDATMLFCLCLCLYFAVRALLEGPRFLPPMALAAGAGFGVKYAALPAVVTCALAAMVSLSRPPRARLASWLGFGLAAVFCALVGFYVASPSAFAHWEDFLAGLTGHRGERFSNHARIFLVEPKWTAPAAWRFYLLDVLPTAFGWPALLLSVVGLVGIFRKSGRLGILLAGSALAGYALIAGTSALFVRYAAPMIPALAVSLGLLLVWAFSRLGQGPLGRWRPALGLVMLVVVFLPPMATAVKFDRLLATPDTRDLASRWVLEQPAGTTAVTEGWFAQVYSLQPTDVAACASKVPGWLNPGVPALPLATASYWPGLIARGDQGWGALAQDASKRYIFGRYRPETADLVVQGYPLLPCGLRGRREVPALDPTCFELVRTFSPGTPTCDSYLDMFDAFWVPFSGFHGQERPGPEIQIFQNRCSGGASTPIR